MPGAKKSSSLTRLLDVFGFGSAVGNTKKLVGLDIGTSTIKAVELTKAGNEFVITGFAKCRIAADEPPQNAIRALLHERNMLGSPVATAVSGQSIIVRHILLPDLSDDRLEKAVKEEAPKYIPFEISDVSLDFQRLGTRQREGESAESRVALVAAKRHFISEHVTLMQQAGLHLQAIDVDCFAINNAFDFYASRTADDEGEKEVENVALIDIGGAKTEINILEKGNLAFTREIYVSGDDFTQEIARRCNVDPEKAEKLKSDPEEDSEKVALSIQRVLEDLARETRLSFDYFEHQTDENVKHVYLSGGGSRLTNLREGLEEKIGIPTELWDPTEGLAVDDSLVSVDELQECAPQLTVAVGLASRLT